MKIFFTHTHNFKKFKKNHYTTGGLTNVALKRYYDYCDELLIGARITESSYETVKNLSLVSEDKIFFKKFSYNFKVFKNIKECVKQSDYVIARLPSLFGIIAVIYSKIYKKKVLVEVVGNAFEALWYHSLKGRVFAFPFHYLTKFSIYYADYVSYITKEYLQRIYPTKGIYKGGLSNIVIDDDNFIDDKVLHNRLKKIENEQSPFFFKIGMIANLNTKYKGHDIILKTISKLKENLSINFCLELVGGGDKEGLLKKIKKYDLEKNVNILGNIPNELIFEWYDTVDIYIQPSKTEAHGRSVIESMSRGCAVISSDIGGMKETVADDFRFKIKNNDEFVKKLERLILNKQDRKLQAIRNFNKAKEFGKSKTDNKRKAFFNLIFT